MDVYSWFRRSLSRPKKTNTPSTAAATTADTSGSKDKEAKLHGITDQLIEFVKSLSFETFKNLSLPDDVGGSNGGRSDGTSGNVSKDLSEWQERHAMLVLSKVKELSQLRFRLCPRYMKERQFWRVYFMLVKSYVMEYELQAVRMAKLEQMRLENGSQTNTNAFEVEMSESKPETSVDLHDSDRNGAATFGKVIEQDMQADDGVR